MSYCSKKRVTKPTRGYGYKIYGRGDTEPELEEIEKITEKKQRGRPRKNLIEPSGARSAPIGRTSEPEEEEFLEEKTATKYRGRPRITHSFQSNVTDTLNNLMGQLAIQERETKQLESDPELKREELKRLRAMQKQISKVYLSYV